MKASIDSDLFLVKKMIDFYEEKRNSYFLWLK